MRLLRHNGTMSSEVGVAFRAAAGSTHVHHPACKPARPLLAATAGLRSLVSPLQAGHDYSTACTCMRPQQHPAAAHTAPATPPAAKLLQICDHVRLRLSTSRCLRSAMTGAFCSSELSMTKSLAAGPEVAPGGTGGRPPGGGRQRRRRRRPLPAQAVVRPVSQPPRPALACAGSRCSREAALELGRWPERCALEVA